MALLCMTAVPKALPQQPPARCHVWAVLSEAPGAPPARGTVLKEKHGFTREIGLDCQQIGTAGAAGATRPAAPWLGALVGCWIMAGFLLTG